MGSVKWEIVALVPPRPQISPAPSLLPCLAPSPTDRRVARLLSPSSGPESPVQPGHPGLPAGRFLPIPPAGLGRGLALAP